MRMWNYRVIEQVTPLQLNTPSGATDVYRAIHAVYYDSDGRPVAHSESPATIGWEPTEGDDAPLALLDRMREALVKPVLTEQDFQSRDAGIEAPADFPTQGAKPFPDQGQDVSDLKGMFGPAKKVVPIEQMDFSSSSSGLRRE